jgi:hypothetical protein
MVGLGLTWRTVPQEKQNEGGTLKASWTGLPPIGTGRKVRSTSTCDQAPAEQHWGNGGVHGKVQLTLMEFLAEVIAANEAETVMR